MTGNGCAGQVNQGVGALGPGVQHAGSGVPYHMFQFGRGCRLFPREYRSRANEANYLVALVGEEVGDGGSDQTGGTGNEYPHRTAPTSTSRPVQEFGNPFIVLLIQKKVWRDDVLRQAIPSGK
jgi:hypothetical protein